MTKLLVLDFETKDEYACDDVGAGWAYDYNYPKGRLNILGCAIITSECKEYYTTNMVDVLEQVYNHDELLAFNAQYELGLLKVLEKRYPEFEGLTEHRPIHDSMLLAKLFDPSLESYSLDNVAKRYLGTNKDNDKLIQIVKDNNLAPKRLKSDKQFEKFAKTNMDILQNLAPDIVGEYAIKDCRLTLDLYNLLKAKLPQTLIDIYSVVTHTCVSYRLKGIPVDLKYARQFYKDLGPELEAKLGVLYSITNQEFNPNSPKQVTEQCKLLGIKIDGKTKKGAPKTDKKWMIKQNHPLCKAIIEYKETKNLRENFIKKILDYQTYTGLENEDIGYVYPEWNILQARTGRLSSSNPNIQQQSPTVRRLFIPFKGERWFSLDFSGQELRLQLHYAHLLKCPGTQYFVNKYMQDPKFDLHMEVARLIDKPKKVAKGINFGLSYGMGQDSFARNLDINLVEADRLKEKYNEICPYLVPLDQIFRSTMKKVGYIKTLAGRKLPADKPVYEDGKWRHYEYRALNKATQGSGLDQCILAMVTAYRRGIPILFPLHDELCISGTREQAEELKQIMESALPLCVPSYTEIKEGSNWQEASK